MPGFVTDEFFLYDPADLTTQMKFNVAALNTGAISTLVIPLPSGFSGSASVAYKNYNNFFTVSQAITGALSISPSSSLIALAVVADASQATDIAQFTTSGFTGFAIDKNGHVVSGNATNTGIILADVSDATKLWDLRCGNITTGTTRVANALNFNGGLVIVGNDPPAVAAGALGKVDLTGQTAAITSTNLSNGAAAGVYLVSYTIADTTADVTAGTIQFQVNYTDVVGATTQTGAALVLTATGRDRGSFVVQLASGEISYQTNLTGIIGTAQYAVYVRVVALG